MKKMLVVMVSIVLVLGLSGSAWGASREVSVANIVGSANSLATNPAQYLNDGKLETVWRTTSEEGYGWAELQLQEEVLVDGIRIYGAYQGLLTVEYWSHNGWRSFLTARDLRENSGNPGWNLLDLSYDRVVSNRIRLWLVGNDSGKAGGIAEIQVLGRRVQDLVRRIDPLTVSSEDRFQSGWSREEPNPAEYLFDHNTYTGWKIHTGNQGAPDEVGVDLGADSAIDRIKIYNGVMESATKGAPKKSSRLTIQYQTQGLWRDIPGLVNLDLTGLGSGWRSFELAAGTVHTGKLRLLFQGEERFGVLKEVEIWGRNSTGLGSDYMDCGGAPLQLTVSNAGNYEFTYSKTMGGAIFLHMAGTGDPAKSQLTWELNGRPMGALAPAANVHGIYLYRQPLKVEDYREGPNFIRVKGAGITIQDCRIEISKETGLTLPAGHSLGDRLALTPATGSETLDLGGKFHLDELRLNYLGEVFSGSVWVERENHWVELAALRNESGAMGGTMVYANPGLVTQFRISNVTSGSPTEVELPGSGVNDGPPRVHILGPLDGELLSLSEWAKTLLTGTVDNPAAEVRVNGRKVSLEGTGFEVSLSSLGLKTGEAQTIEVVATDPAGRTGTDQITVGIGLALGFTLNLPDQLIYTKESQITVSGQILVSNCQVFVNGVEVPAPNRSFSTVVSLAEGYNPILVKVTFGAFNFSALKLREVVRGSAPPYLKVLTPAEGQITSAEALVVSGQVSSTQPVTVTVNGQLAMVEGGSFHSNPITLQEGANGITVIATDKTGLKSQQELVVYRDGTAPSLKEILPVEGANLNTTVVAVSGKATDVSPVWVMVNGMAADISVGANHDSPVQWAVNINGVEGWNELKIEARDAAGNVTAVILKYFIDTNPPVAFTPTANPTGWTNNNRPTITFGTTDGESGIDHYEIAVGSGSWTTPVVSPYQFPQGIPDGEQTVRVKAVDKAGNEMVGEVQVHIDTTPPAVPEGFEVISGIGRVTLRWENPGGEIRGYRVERNPVFGEAGYRELYQAEGQGKLEGMIDEAVTPGNTYTYILKAFDRAGNYSAATQAITVKAGITVSEVTADGGTVKFENCEVTLAQDAVTGNNQVVIQPETVALPENSYAAPVGAVYSLKLVDPQTGEEKPVEFTEPVSLKVNYAGLQLPEGYTEADLGIYWYDGEGGYWEKLEGVFNDLGAQTLTVNLEHFSDYQVMASQYNSPSLQSYYDLGVSPYGSYFQDNVETVSPASGNLTVSATDLKLPGPNGFDLVIKRIYDFGADQQEKILNTNPFLQAIQILFGKVLTKNGDSYQVSLPPMKRDINTFGDGWSLNIPWIDKTDKGMFLHLPEGQAVKVKWKYNRFEYHQGMHFVLERTTDPSEVYSFIGNRYLLTLKDGTKYEFSKSGKPIYLYDPSGKNFLHYEYGGSKLTRIVDSLNREVTFTYKTVGGVPLIGEINCGDRKWVYNYDENGMLQEVLDPLNRKTAYEYETHSLRSGSSSHVTGGGRTDDQNKTFSYSLGLLNKITYPTREALTYTYDLKNQSHSESWTETYTYQSWNKPTDEHGDPLPRNKDNQGYQLDTVTVSYSISVSYYGTKILVTSRNVAGKVTSYDYELNPPIGSFRGENFSPGYSYVGSCTITEGTGDTVYRKNVEIYGHILKQHGYFMITQAELLDVISLKKYKNKYISDIGKCYKGQVTVASKTLDANDREFEKTLLEYNLPLQLVSREEHYRGGQFAYEIRTEYDGWGNPTYRMDGSRNLEETWSYESHDRIHNLVETEVKKNHNPLTNQTITTTTSYEYDEDLGKPVQVQTTASDGTPGQMTSFEYYDNGNLKTRRDDNGLVTVMEYDSYLYPLRKTVHNVLDANDAPVGDIVTEYQYDYNTGWRLSETDPRGYTTSYQYDLLGRIVRVTLPTENGVTPERSYLFDDAHNTCVYSNENGQKTKFVFDGLGRLTTIIKDPDGINATTSYEYDNLGRIVKVTDPLGEATSYDYDTLGRVIKVTFPKSNRNDSQKPFVMLVYKDTENSVTITDENGGQVMEQSDWANRLVRAVQVYGFGNEATQEYNWSFSYDSLGNKLQQVDPLYNQTNQEFDGMGRMKKVQLPETMAWIGDIQQNVRPELKYEYDRMGNKVAETDAKGNRTEYGYDLLGRMVKVTTSAKDTFTGEITTAVTKTFYDKVGNKERVQDANGNDWTYTYSARGYLLSEKDPLGNETRYQYDAMGNKTAVTDPLNRKTVFEYDQFNRLVKTTLPDDSYTQITYDAVGNKLEERDMTGLVTVYTYTPRNWVETVTVGGQLRATYTYDAKGNQIEVKDALNNGTRNEYDSLGRLRKVTHPSGISESFKYDKVGNRIEVTDGRQNSVKYEYNPLGWLSKITDPLWNVTAYEYDVNGNQVKQTAANNLVATFTYDELNRMTGKIDSLRNSTKYSYDPVGNRKQMQDARGTMWNYTYLKNNWLDNVNVVNGTETYWVRYTYDAAGNRTKVEDPGNTNNYTYDILGRLAEVERKFDTATYTTGYEYSGGLLTGIKYPGASSWLRYNYNGLRQLDEVVGFTQPGGIQYEADGALKNITYSNGVATNYSYDADRRLSTLTAASGSTNILAQSYTYDNAGNITKINDKTYEYDKNNQLTKAVTPGKFLEDKVTSGSPGVFVGDILGTTGLYFGAEQRAIVSVDSKSTSIGLDFGTVAPGVKKILFVPDQGHQVHRVTQKTFDLFVSDDNRKYTLVGRDKWEYAKGEKGIITINLKERLATRYLKIHVWYDNRDVMFVTKDKATFLNELGKMVQVYQEAASRAEEYQYDAAGNRTLEKVTLVQVESKNSFYYANSDRLKTDEKYAFKYDNAGNLTDKGNISISTINGDQVTFGTPGANDEYWHYTYDLLNRLTKVEKNGTLIAEYQYDPEGLRVVKKAHGETIHYVFEGTEPVYEKNITTEKIHSYIYAMGKHLARIDGVIGDSTARRYWYTTDQLGSVKAATDETGKVVFQADHLAFGQRYGESCDAGFGEWHSFTGKEFDPDTGLYYFNARWYDPDTGRFISEDPAMDPNNPNLYSYCANNPVKNIDPTGLWEYEADSTTGEIYAVAEEGDTMAELGQEVYGSSDAYTDLAEINEIENPDVIDVGQKIRLEQLEDYDNEKYDQLLRNSFITGDLSYDNLVSNGVTINNFSGSEIKFLSRYVEKLEALHKAGKIKDEAYSKELDRLGGKGAVYELAFGNISSGNAKKYAAWNKGAGVEFNEIDETLLDIITVKTMGGDVGVKWSFPGVSYNGKTKVKSIGASIKAEIYIVSVTGNIPLGPVTVTIGGKIGVGFSLKGGYTPGDQKVFGASAAFGFGVELGIKPNF